MTRSGHWRALLGYLAEICLRQFRFTAEAISQRGQNVRYWPGKGPVTIANVTEEPGTSEFHQAPVGTLGHFCTLDPVSGHYVKHDFVRGHEVVCNDAAMALPPDRLRNTLLHWDFDAQDSAAYRGQHGIVVIA